MSKPEAQLILSCEHAGHRVPAALRDRFAGRQALLRSHRGWDPGALSVARGLARRLGAPLLAQTISRLVVDVNRSPHHPRVFSPWTHGLPAAERAELLARIHAPHWQRVREAIAAAPGPVVHVAVHSFTPRLGTDVRRFRVGLLYDPARRRERVFAVTWQAGLRERLGRAAVRRNAPYRGSADGLTTAMRREMPPRRYLGLELELCQAALSAPREHRALVAMLADTLRVTLAALP